METDRRIRRTSDFTEVHQRGRSIPGPLVIVKVLARPGEVTRFGFVAGKRVGGAVVRNLVKRRLREIARQIPVREGHDVVVIARAPAATATFKHLWRAMADGLRRAKIAGGAPIDTPAASLATALQ